MARFGAATSGKTLDPIEGFAGLRPTDIWYRVRRTALTCIAAGALLAGLAATLAALKGVADAGVTSEAPGGLVRRVVPTGFAWEAGMRVGQIVLFVGESGPSGGWRMSTTDGTSTFEANEDRPNANLRGSLAVGLVGIALGCLALLFLRTRRRWVLPAAAFALAASAFPLQLEGRAELSTIVLGAAAFVPTAAFTIRLPRHVFIRDLATVVAGGLILAWATARLTGDPASANAEWLRGTVAWWAAIALVIERAVVPAMTRQTLRVTKPRIFDLLVVAGFAMVAVVVGTLLDSIVLVTVVLTLAALAVVPAARERIGRPIEAVLLGDIRQQAAAEASEVERARLARELHDVPLQELAAVIRRLEIVPGTEAESENLRALAGHLRNVATELRPPVLDDLGLPAALEFLAEEATTAAMSVAADVVDDTGFGTDRRPPTEVELAMFRIASEAVGNAIRHSGGTEVRLRASVAPDRVELEVSDDGAGLAREAARDATKRKRLGLASMRRRAEAIDAELTIDSSKRGATIRVTWQA